MSNYKTILIVLCGGLLLYSCKPAAYNFSYKKSINRDFIETIVSMTDYKGVNIDSIKIYRALLTETLVERDRIPEFTLLNSKSKQEHAKLSDINNYHHLYLFEIIPDGTTDTLIIYLGSSFSGDAICTRAGPVYFGKIRSSRLRFENVFTMNKESKVSFVRNTEILFFNEEVFPAPVDRTTPLRINQIVRNEPNKIGGTKAVIFSTEKVFGDADALVFTYYATIK
jgi:hypothetical protein